MPDSPIPILARGDGWLVVAKPPRVIVHRNANARNARAMLQRVRNQIGQRVNLVHRLDRNASGCLILATDGDMHREMAAALQAPESVKTYLAFVRGHFNRQGPVEVRTPIKIGRGHKDAWSTVDCLGTCVEPRSSLLRVRPHTGRNHQVRRHVRDLGHPIVFDREHGDSRINRFWRERHPGLDRLGLHCLSIELTLPNGEPLSVTCPLFADHQDLWSQTPWWGDATAAEPRLLEPGIVWHGNDGMDAWAQEPTPPVHEE